MGKRRVRTIRCNINSVTCFFFSVQLHKYVWVKGGMVPVLRRGKGISITEMCCNPSVM